MESKEIKKLSFAEQLAIRTQPYFDRIANEGVSSVVEKFDRVLTDLSKIVEVLKGIVTSTDNNDSYNLEALNKLNDLEEVSKNLNENFITLKSSISEGFDSIKELLNGIAIKDEKKQEDKVTDVQDNSIELIKDSVLRNTSELSKQVASGSVSVLQKVVELSDTLSQFLDKIDAVDNSDETDEQDQKDKAKLDEEVKEAKSNRDKTNKETAKQFASLERTVKSTGKKIPGFIKLILFGVLGFIFKDVIAAVWKLAVKELHLDDRWNDIKQWTKNNYPGLYEKVEDIYNNVLSLIDFTNWFKSRWNSLLVFFNPEETRAAEIAKAYDLAGYDLIEDKFTKKGELRKISVYFEGENERYRKTGGAVEYTIPRTDVTTFIPPDVLQNLLGIKFNEEELNQINEERTKKKDAQIENLPIKVPSDSYNPVTEHQPYEGPQERVVSEVDDLDFQKKLEDVKSSEQESTAQSTSVTDVPMSFPVAQPESKEQQTNNSSVYIHESGYTTVYNFQQPSVTE